MKYLPPTTSESGIQQCDQRKRRGARIGLTLELGIFEKGRSFGEKPAGQKPI